MNRVELPNESGAYRWYYADAKVGQYTAVVIFMVGSIFSARYSQSAKRGGRPREHAAVNFALYDRGAPYRWVLTEYQSVSVEADGLGLRIGRSTFRYEGGGVTFHIKDQTTPFMATEWGQPTEAVLRLMPVGPSGHEVQLVEGMPHFWRPIWARCTATLSLPGQDLTVSGDGYHDGNHGAVPLGSDLSGWEWVRTVTPTRTDVVYRPWQGGLGWRVRVTEADIDQVRGAVAAPPLTRTGWGLRVPSTLLEGQTPALLESSPFYARLEAQAASAHAVGEVADFRKFHSPTVRWMSNFKTRLGGAS
jgi:carotenoid 1,2-hydratase